jgi:hypothetical protein
MTYEPTFHVVKVTMSDGSVLFELRSDTIGGRVASATDETALQYLASDLNAALALAAEANPDITIDA